MKYLFLLLITVNTFAQTSFCNKKLEKLPIQAGGRVKPLYVHAAETLKFISGKSKVDGTDPTTAYCQLSFEFFRLSNNLKLKLRVDHIKSKKVLDLKPHQNYILASKAANYSDEVKAELMSLKLNDAYKKDLTKVFNRIETYKSIVAAEDWKLPASFSGKKVDWLPLKQALREDIINELKNSSSTPFAAFFNRVQDKYIQAAGDDYLLELTYKKAHLFSWAMVAALLALAFGLTLRRAKLFTTFAGLTILIQIIGITMRVMISGRAPITNMYETVMFSGFGALIIGTIISLIKKERVYTMGALAYNIMCIMMMTFANDMLDSSISPLVPVLRDNFWLSTHVTTIILSYAALALSWILANSVMVSKLFGKNSYEQEKRNVDLIYTCLKSGVVMLAAGIILGGVWADYSWGRFWGWDPKETWSLIVLLIYMAILHGKYTSWINNKRFVPLVAAAFMSVMMAWFGVNYILASGLHSYGFSQGGAIFLGSFFAIQIAVLLVHMIKKKTEA